MTEQELRNLDAWIAEHVMGESPLADWPTQCPACSVQVPDGYAHLATQSDRPGLDGQSARFCLAGHRITLTRRYSTDIAAAWEVVERLRESWSIKISSNSDGWYCGVFRSAKVVAFGKGMLPIAICLAAKSAIDQERCTLLRDGTNARLREMDKKQFKGAVAEMKAAWSHEAGRIGTVAMYPSQEAAERVKTLPVGLPTPSTSSSEVPPAAQASSSPDTLS